VARAENTGQLEVNRPGGKARFAFREGRVDHAETDLLRGTAKQLEGDPKLLVEEATFEVLRRDMGDFSWNSEEPPSSDPKLALNLEDLLDAVDQRWSELDLIRGIIPSEKSVLKIASSPPEHVREITVTRAQWALLAYLDGRRTVEVVAGEADLGEFHVLRTLYPIAERGLLEVDATAADATGSSDAQIDLTDSNDAGSVRLVRSVGEGT
jgi:hypothetical protein